MKHLLVVTCICLLSCNNHKEIKKQDAVPEEKKEIFPVVPFFTQQMHEVDSLQLPIVKYTTTNQHTVASSLDTRGFHEFAREFLEPDLSKPAYQDLYKETNFADQSVPNITFTYSTTSPAMEVRRMDVILEPSPISADKIKTVYIEKFRRVNDTLIIKKLYWKADRNYQIITSKELANKPAVITQLKVSWYPE